MAELKLFIDKTGKKTNRYIYTKLTPEEKDIKVGNLVNEANSLEEEFVFLKLNKWKEEEYAECKSAYGTTRAFYLDSIKRSTKELEQEIKDKKKKERIEKNKDKELIKAKREAKKKLKEDKLKKALDRKEAKLKSKGYINKKTNKK